MVAITTIQNILMFFTFTFLALYLLSTAVESKPHWFLSKTLLKCRKMEKDYERFLQSRRDMLHHYYWGQSNGQKKKMKDMEKEIIRIDQKLQQMRSEYELVRKGLPVPLKMF